MPPNTRPSNKKKDKQPKPKNRRTPQEVSDDKKAAAARKKQEKAERLAAQREVAEFETEERQHTANRKARAGRPRDDGDEQMEKANHKRAASSDIEESKCRKNKDLSRKGETKSDDNDDDDNDDDLAMKDAQDFGDDRSEDEYEDQSGEEDSDEEASEGSESESMEEEVSDEDDDGAGKPVRKVNGKKEKKVKAGAANRAAIRAILGDGSREIIDGKQRGAHKDKLKSHKGQDGLRSNWQQQATLLPPPGPRVISSKHSLYDSEEENPYGPDDEGPLQQEGRLFDDYDEEMQFMPLNSTAKSTAKIQRLENSTKIFKKTGAKSSPSTGLVKNLSKRARPYYKEYKAHVINAVGEEDPWFMPLDGHICDWWNELVGGDKKARITSKDGDDRAYDDFKEIKRLTRGSILSTEWKTKLGETAIKAVKAEWEIRKLYTPEARSTLSKNMLGSDPRNRSSTDRPFIFEGTDQVDWDGCDPNTEESGGGMFMSRPVLKTFAKHIAIVNGHGTGRGAVKLSKAPRGTLMMAIQVVNRTYEYTLSGEVKIPAKRDKTGHFSEENWGDYKKVVEKNGVSKRVRVRRATVFAATIDAELDEERWKIVINAAKNLIPNSLDAAEGADEATESEEEAVIIRDARFKRQTQAAPAMPETPAAAQASSSSSLPSSSTA